MLGERGVDLGNDLGVFDDELERNDVSGGVDSFVGTGAAYKGRLFAVLVVVPIAPLPRVAYLLGVGGVGGRDGAGLHKRLEEITLN